MSLYDCNSCSACGGNCDRCTATVCLKNMESHKEIYKLTNEFDNKFHQAAQNLYDRCIEIRNNLLNNYGINIDISSIYDTILCEDFLLKIRNKQEESHNYINKLKQEIENIKKEKNEKINDLNNLYFQHKNEIDTKFKEEENKYKIVDSKYNEIINSKKQIINKLINERDSIFIDIDKLVKDFIYDERKKLEKEFDVNKGETDKKNMWIEKEFKYSKEEETKREEYLEQIKKIKSYSDKIPNYENWIMAFNLNKYIN